MTAVVFGGFGLIIGSFLNVLILRHGIHSLGGRSMCMSCGKKIFWYDNVPVLSWVLLRGRCRMCGAPISLQYPLIEAMTGALFAVVGISTLALPAQIFGCAIAALLLAIAAYDLRHTIIPDPWVYTFAALALVSQLLFAPQSELSILTLLSGPIVAAPLFALWFFSRGAWMGFGDVKLALGIGWLLGPLYGIAAIFFAFVIGAAVGVPLLLLSSDRWRRFVQGFIPHRLWYRSGKGFTMKSEIPFGPFLVASTLIVWLLLIYSLDPLAFVGLSSSPTFQ